MVLFVHQFVFLSNNLICNIKSHVFADDHRKDGKCDNSASNFLNHFFKPLHLWGFSVGHLDSIGLTRFSFSVFLKNWSENHFSKFSLFEDEITSSNHLDNSHERKITFVHSNLSIVSFSIVPCDS